jgi:transcriptional regulator with XRE-family HTH domain
MAVDLGKIGSILRTRREEKGISLDEVSNALCLRKSLIQAIETGKWGFLPHEVYVRSYLKEYANFLKIYENILPELTEKNNEIEPETKTDTQAIEKPIRRFRKIAFTNMPRKALVYPAIVLILSGFYMIDKMKRDYNSIPVPKIETTAGISAHSQTSAENTVTMERQTTPGISEGKKLMITCKERTWVSVVIDDTEKKEFMLNAEEMIILNAKYRFDLLIGNAGGVKLILNGKDTEFTGKSGEVKRIKLS